MDVAYDHIVEESLPADAEGSKEQEHQETENKPVGLNAEFQEAFKAVSASPWGARLGGFFGQLKTQGESLYTEAQKEYTNASEQATKGLSGIRDNIAQRARAISIQQPTDDIHAASFSDPMFVLPETQPTASDSKDKGKQPESSTKELSSEDADRPDSLTADIVKEATSMVSKFRLDATSRLQTVRKAEDAADEALLRFGTNIRNFLRDAVTVTAPSDAGVKGAETRLLFETNDAEGKRIFHSSRFDARLHAIHSRLDSFAKDPEGEEWDKWKDGFDIDKETERIAGDLDKHEELRRSMEKLVPEKVEYKDFWRRYYFLRMVVEEEERRRKEVLKGAAAEAQEEVGWGDDDEEDDESTTPVNAAMKTNPASQSTTTLTPTTAAAESKEKSPRRSNEDDKKSSADSDASYDIVSGATSKTPNSPKLETKKEESDDEDWE